MRRRQSRPPHLRQIHRRIFHLLSCRLERVLLQLDETLTLRGAFPQAVGQRTQLLLALFLLGLLRSFFRLLLLFGQLLRFFFFFLLFSLHLLVTRDKQPVDRELLIGFRMRLVLLVNLRRRNLVRLFLHFALQLGRQNLHLGDLQRLLVSRTLVQALLLRRFRHCHKPRQRLLQLPLQLRGHVCRKPIRNLFKLRPCQLRLAVRRLLRGRSRGGRGSLVGSRSLWSSRRRRRTHAFDRQHNRTH